ncbi:hypothetical protein BJY01DRAFT_245675 [Aspergillus pseudoustus]|uniref:Uncharacterized protein n=1 Tax=Aspergillus pseudoustus TaxID=1810923 RepID=A0ABR4KD44_9EURO
MAANTTVDGKVYNYFPYSASPSGEVVASYLIHEENSPVKKVKAFVAPYETLSPGGTHRDIVIGIQLVYEDDSESAVLGSDNGTRTDIIECDTITSMTINSADRIDSIYGQDSHYGEFHAGNPHVDDGEHHDQATGSHKLLGFHGTWTRENTIGPRSELVSLGAIFRA